MPPGADQKRDTGKWPLETGRLNGASTANFDTRRPGGNRGMPRYRADSDALHILRRGDRTGWQRPRGRSRPSLSLTVAPGRIEIVLANGQRGTVGTDGRLPVLWWVSSGRLSGDDYPDRERATGLAGDRPAPRTSACLCRMVAFTLNNGCPGSICGEGACINRKRRTKLAEESGSMRLLAW